MEIKYYLSWPTHNREDSLIRSIESLNNLEKNSYTITISNSGPELTQGKIKADIFETSRREDWIQKLNKIASAQGIPSEVVRFALLPELPHETKAITTGSNRNFLLLKLVGKKFFSFDDDILLDVKKIILPKDSSYLSASKSNPFNMKFFISEKELHDSLESSESVTLNYFLDSHLKLLENHAISMSGIYGDSGLRSPRMIFGFDEDSLTSLLKAPQEFQTAMSSRLLCRYSDSTLSLKASPFMPACSGFANDQELPPFFPIGRNEDGAFVYTLLGTQNSNIGIVPFAVNHSPKETRNYDGTMKEAGCGINDLICLLWINFLQTQNSHGYKASSNYFKRVSSLSQKEFGDFIDKLVVNNFEGKLRRLDEKIINLRTKKLTAFPEWLVGAEIEKENYRKVITNPYKSSPLEFNLLNFSDSLELTKKLIQNYGELLSHWPTLRKIALTLD